MQKSLFFILLISSVVARAAKPTPTLKPTPTPKAITPRTLKYYEIGKTDGPLLYTQITQYETLPDGKMSTKTTTKNPKGEVVFTESILSNGSRPILQIADVAQTKRHLEMEVKDGTVYLRGRSTAVPPAEAPKEDHEKAPDNLFTGALSENFALEHFDALMAGETVSGKMGIMEIRDLVTFKFWKTEEKKMGGRDVVVIAMKPSSILIALIVDTIYLYIDLKEKKMVHYVGRTPLWKEVNGKLKALDAEIVFE